MEHPTQRLWHVARLLVAQHRYELAEQPLRELLAIEPSHGHAPSALAFVLVELRRYDDALRQAREAVAAQPNYYYSHFTLARILSMREDFDASRPAAMEALRLYPYWSRSYTIPAIINYELDQLEPAMEFIEHGLSVDPTDQDLARYLAMVLAAMGDDTGAEAATAEFLRTSPEHPWSHTAAGWVCWHLGRDDRAVEYLTEAIALNPNQFWSHEGMGLVLARQGKSQPAIEHLNLALGMNPFLQKARRCLSKLDDPVRSTA